MIRALRTAATGMFAQQLSVDTIANNLANVNTTGFKKAKIEFQDLLYENQRAIGAVNAQGVTIPTEIQIGHGSTPVSVQKMFNQGDISNTGNPLDMAIDGDGFFQVVRNDGTLAYTRDGTFKVSADGRVVTSDGLILDPEIQLPQETSEININLEGVISVILAGETEPQEIGQIQIARFINPAGLENLGGNIYMPTAASGEPLVSNPGLDGAGTIRQGYAEMSNVQVVEEMVAMIIAQRAYEINSKTILTAEEMLRTATNIRQ